MNTRLLRQVFHLPHNSLVHFRRLKIKLRGLFMVLMVD